MAYEVVVRAGELSPALLVDTVWNRQPSENPPQVYLARLVSESSRSSMRSALQNVAELLGWSRYAWALFPWERLGYQYTQAVRAGLIEARKSDGTRKWSPAQVNKTLSAVRGVLQEAWRLGLISIEDFHRATDFKAVRGSDLRRGRDVSDAEVRRLFEVCKGDDSAGGRRDEALFVILFGAGVRRAESVLLNVADYDASLGSFRIRQGKGRKSRMVYLAAGSKPILETWLAKRGEEAGPLLCPVHKSGIVRIQRMSMQAVYNIVRKRRLEAEVQHFSPHDARRTWIGNLLDAGVDISVVQQLAGHATVSTTQTYDRRGERVKRAAAQKVALPVG